MLSLLLVMSTAGQSPDTTIDYNVTLEGVKEVCLLGHADLSYWEARLEKEGLHPTVRDGHAELLICTFSSRWKGVRFREGVISVFTSREKGGSQRDGFFLVRAFNTVRPFAWVERTFYKAPYYPAEISEGSLGHQSYITLTERGELVLEAKMAGHAEPQQHAELAWEGPIYLPAYMVSATGPGKLFYARLEGMTDVFPFVAGQDSLRIGSVEVNDASRYLTESGFSGIEWWIRDAGRHGKSRSMSRP